MTYMDDCFKIFINAIGFVASTPEQQRSALPPFVDIADEVALTFEEAYVLSPQLYEDGVLSPTIMTSLQKLNKLFDYMSSEHQYWTFESMQQDERWEMTRTIARQIWDGLGIKGNYQADSINDVYTWMESRSGNISSTN